MSDLLSPIYVVFDANEGDAFWGLVGVMKMMVRRDLLNSFEREYAKTDVFRIRRATFFGTKAV